MEWNKEQKDKYIQQRDNKYGQAFFGMVHNHVIEKLKVGLIEESKYQEEYMKQLTNCINTEIALDKLRNNCVEVVEIKKVEAPKRSF